MSEYLHGLEFAGGLAAVSFIKYMWLAWVSRRRRLKLLPVGTITELNMYPLKSGRSVKLDNAECALLGFTKGALKDRQLMVARNGETVTARQHPKLVLVSLSEVGGYFIFDGPGMEPLSVPCDNEETSKSVFPCQLFDDVVHAIDLGDEAARWFSQYLAVDCRLLAYKPGHSKRYLSGTIKPWQDQSREEDEVAFADFAGYLVTTEASLDEVNTHMDTPISMRQFRPNIVISGVPAFTEENWNYVEIGDVKFRCVEICTRCVETTVDPDKGVKNKDGQPLKTLLKTHKDPTRRGLAKFGVYLSLDNPGIIRVGDTVMAM